MEQIMKALIASLILVFLATAASADGFCPGFEAGYKAGYCYQQFGCLPPIPPICPIPMIGERGYQAGYNRGLLAGVGAHQERGQFSGDAQTHYQSNAPSFYFVHPQTVEPVYPTVQRPRFFWLPQYAPSGE